MQPFVETTLHLLFFEIYKSGLFSGFHCNDLPTLHREGIPYTPPRSVSGSPVDCSLVLPFIITVSTDMCAL